jgi:hypothetical protein
MIYEDSSGNEHLLAGSSSESYVYELETGTNDVSTAINGYFETKSTDCNLPNIKKYYAFIDVAYGMVYGTLTYEVFIDEVSSLTGTLQLGNSASRPVGIGSMMVGDHSVGKDYDPNTTFASLAQNSCIRINCDYLPGKKISVRFSNNVTGENFVIDRVSIWYLEGNVYDQ